TQAGTAGRHHAIFRHGELLLGKGERLHRYTFDAVYLLAGVRFLRSFFPMRLPLGCAKSWQLLGGRTGSKSPVHPNDDVNMGQSSNDTFPTAMHIAAVLELEEHLLPHAEALATSIEAKANEWMDVVKTGRTHLMDAVPLTVGQEWSGWAHQIRDALARIRACEAGLFELAAGGTAVGTGLNAPPHFSREIAEKIAELTGYPFVTAPN